MATWTTPRTWVAGNVVTAAQLNTDIRDNMNVGRGYTTASRVAGNYALNSAAAANVDTAVDLTIAAATGDRLVVVLGALSGAEAVDLDLDCYTTAGLNYFSRTGLTGTCTGFSAWLCGGSLQLPIGSPNRRVLIAGDISAGNAVVRLRYKANGGKTIYANANNGFEWYVLNFGPAV